MGEEKLQKQLRQSIALDENKKFDIEFNGKLNFTTLEFNYLMEYSGFTVFEKNVFKLRQNGRSNTEISLILDKSNSTINRTIKSIKQKILRCIKQYYKMKEN